MLARIVITVALALIPLLASGHAPREDYLFIGIDEAGAVQGRFEINSKHLRKALQLSVKNSAGLPDLAAARESAPIVQSYIRDHYRILADGVEIEPRFSNISFLREGSKFVQYHFRGQLEAIPSTLTFRHDMFYEVDPLHRGLVVLTKNPVDGSEYGEMNVAAIFTQSLRVKELELDEPLVNYLQPKGVFRIGFVTYLRGSEHWVFLVVLLLPAVLHRREGELVPVQGFRKAAIHAAAILVSLTLAHAAGLGLSAKGIISIPQSLIGIAVGLSIILAALANLYPRERKPALLVGAALVFGFFHGLTMAANLTAFPYRLTDLTLVLTRFAGGLELAQFAIAIPVFLLFFALRANPAYQRTLVRALSAIALLFGAYMAAVHTLPPHL